MGVTPSPDRQALDRLIDAHRKLQGRRKPAEPPAEESPASTDGQVQQGGAT